MCCFRMAVSKLSGYKVFVMFLFDTCLIFENFFLDSSRANRRATYGRDSKDPIYPLHWLRQRKRCDFGTLYIRGGRPTSKAILVG